MQTVVSWVVTVAVSLVLLGGVSSPAAEPGGGLVIEEAGLRMQLPSEWVEEDLSHRTIIQINGPQKETRRHFRLRTQDGGPTTGYIEYTVDPVPEEPVLVETLDALMRDGQERMELMTPSELFPLVDDKALGCLDGLTILDRPRMTPYSGEPGKHIAMTYSYYCLNSGDPIVGVYWTGFSPDGRKHNIVHTVRQSVLSEQAPLVEAMVASISVPDAG